MPRRKKVADEKPSLLDITAKLRSASNLTTITRHYIKVPQKGFEILQPRHFADLAALRFPQQ